MECPSSKPSTPWRGFGAFALVLSVGPGAVSEQQGGWLVVEDRDTGSVWSFTPNDHEAYPAVVKRTVAERDGRSFIDMYVLCEASKPACDRFVASFKALNEQTKRNLGGVR